MADEIFSDNLLRVIGATLYQIASLQAAREMYGKSYYSLGIGEKIIVDQTVFAAVQGNFAAITPEALKAQPAKPPAGFQSRTD